MPFKARRPAGGFKVMYEYANRLADLGYSVHISYPLKTQYMKYRLPYWVRLLLSYIEGFRTNRWFNFKPSITMSYINSVKDKYVIDADIIITTWWATVLDVGCLSGSKGKKINLIQGFEDWEGHSDLLYASYNVSGMTNVVVASYLEDIVKKHSSNKTELIYNAIDRDQYSIRKPIESRDNLSVCMNYSIQEIKGSKYGIAALIILKDKYPKLQAELFGICPKPKDLPEWIVYHRNPPDLCDIYNRSSIFISNSLTEGFGLVSVEAMSCGCALVCTDIAGHKEYSINGETALLVEPQDPYDMFEKVSSLIDNNDVRIMLAQQGNKYVQHFSWDVAIHKMDNLIKKITSENE